jgi:hypothetical protein
VTFYVYALRDPETLAVHYIGQTYDPLRRLANHQQPSTQSIAMRAWVGSLKERGLSPMLEILEMCSVDEASTIENRVIREHLLQGAPLINKNYGGAWRNTQANYSPPPLASSLLSSANTSTPMTTPTPRLFWAERPRGMRCQGAGCGREPLMGFRDSEGTTFYCAACFSDGTDEAQRTQSPGPKHSVPRFRTPEERARILQCR